MGVSRTQGGQGTRNPPARPHLTDRWTTNRRGDRREDLENLKWTVGQDRKLPEQQLDQCLKSIGMAANSVAGD